MLDDLEDYQPAQPHVTKLNEHVVEAFVRDDLPGKGTMIIMRHEAQEVVARVHHHMGGRHIQAHLLHDAPDWLEVGHAVEMSGQRCALPAHLHRMLNLNEVDFVPEDERTHSLYVDAPDWSTIDTTKSPVTTNVDTLDVMTPVIEGGLTLVVDANEDATQCQSLFVRALDAMEIDEVVTLGCVVDGPWSIHRVVANETTFGWSYALRAAMSWTAQRRDAGKHVCLLVELPTLGGDIQPYGYGIPEPSNTPRLTHQSIIDELSEALPSTATATCTILARLPLGQSLTQMSILIDSISFGDVDTQIALTEGGHYAPMASRTRVDFGAGDARQDKRETLLRAFDRMYEISDQVAIFGEDDVEPEELNLLKLAKAHELVSF